MGVHGLTSYVERDEHGNVTCEYSVSDMIGVARIAITDACNKTGAAGYYEAEAARLLSEIFQGLTRGEIQLLVELASSWKPNPLTDA